ncbi:MAG TPA: type III polyketide synthase [Dermatophilaceae bacterium]
MTAALIGSFGQATPPMRRQMELWNGFFAEHYKHDKVAARLFRGVGVETRHGVVDPCTEDVSRWGTAARMERYVTEALPLGKEALSAAVSSAGLRPEDVGMLIVASCTGYATPGLNVLLARDTGMNADMRSLMLGHMGCYAAVPGLGAAADYVAVHRRPAILLCLELTSLHLQPAPDVSYPLVPETVQQMVVHALFGDGAAAVAVVPDGEAGSLEVVEVAAFTDTTTADMMTWDVTDLGFRMGLSPHVPDVLAKHVRPATEQLLARHGLSLPDVEGWVVHPGGPRILETVGDALDLSTEAIRTSREVLRDYGNCSSATVLLILDRVRAQVSSGGYAVALAFGPGLTLYATLLRAR